jgi:hypothetical protein
MSQPRGIKSRISSLLRQLFLMLLVSAAFFVVGRHLVALQLDKQIRTQVLTRLAQHYPDLVVQIESARRIVGRGIEIRGLSIKSVSEESSYQELVTIDEILAVGSTDITDLVTGQVDVDQVVIQRLTVRAARYPNGDWNVSQLLPLPSFGGTPPKAVLKDSTIELRDLSKPAAGALVLRDIDLQLNPERDSAEKTVFQLAGTLRGDHFKDIQLQGQLVPADGSWSTWGTLDGLEMSPRLLTALPSDLADYASFLATLRARAHFEFQVGYLPGASQPLTCELTGRLTEGRLEDSRLPYPCTDLVADVHCTNEELRIENVKAQIGPSQMQLSCVCQDFLTDAIQIQLSAQIAQLPLNLQLYRSLPASLQSQWKKFQPDGIADVSVTLRTAGNRLVPDLVMKCRDLSFAYYKFPYPIQHASGIVRYHDNRVVIREFAAQAGRQRLYVSGEFTNPGPDFTGWLDLRAAGPIPIDENLLAAMQPAGRRIVRGLSATGMLTLVRGRIERTDSASRPRSRFELDIQNGSVQSERFPYPIHKINGRLLFDNGSWQIQNFNGFHGSSYIECNGHWTPDLQRHEGGTLALHFNGTDLLLDDDLRNGLGHLDNGLQSFWTNMRPRGSIDHVTVALTHQSASRETSFEVEAEKWPPQQNVEGRSISLFPRWMPLRLNNVTGRLRYSNGKIQLIDIRGLHDETEIQLAGEGQIFPDQRWQLQLTRLISDRLRVDRNVVDALPEAVRPALHQLGFRGPLSVNGTLMLSGGRDQPLRAGWDLLLDVENGSMAPRLGLEHIHGGIRLTGEATPQGFASRGELEIDSVICRGVQITQLQGPLWLDKERLVLGSQAASSREGHPPRQITARVVGGTVAADLQMWWKDMLPFTAEASLTNGDIRQIAQALHAERHDASGRAFASLRLNGNAGGLHTLKGNGHVRLRQADIYELPVMVALLSFVSLRPADTTAFTSSDIDFHVDGAQMYLDRIDFSGDAISLKGEGWIDLNHRIDLSFYALVGRQEYQLPIVSALLAEASRNILRIQVSGTVDQPHVTRQALPELDETLQRIFPEATIQPNRAATFWPLPSGASNGGVESRR